MKTEITCTYIEYLQKVSQYKDISDEGELLQPLKDFQKLAHLSYNFLPAFYIFDFSKRKYIFCSEGIKRLLGYDAKEFIEGGHAFMIEIEQKDFFKTYNDTIFPYCLNFLQNNLQFEHINYTFSFNTRLKNNTGKWINILQKCNYITSKDKGLPLYSFGMFLDITCIKKDNVIIHTIEKSGTGSDVSNLIAKNCFFPFEEDQMLTRQEKNILGYMAEGLSSKMLADKLSISENTVSNHRQNIIRKTNTNNVAQLIAFSIRNGII